MKHPINILYLISAAIRTVQGDLGNIFWESGTSITSHLIYDIAIEHQPVFIREYRSQLNIIMERNMEMSIK